MSLALLLLPLLALAAGEAEPGCPEESLSPCACVDDYVEDYRDGEVRVDCTGASTSAEIARALKGANWPSTRLWQFYMNGTPGVKHLPDGVLAHLSFQSIWLNDTRLKRVHPSVLLLSGSRLVNLTVQFARLEEFPFRLLPEFPRLRSLWLESNLLTSVPALQSESLEILDLDHNRITRVEEDGWATPNLRDFDLRYNPLSKFPSTVIASLEKLERFYCSGCNLGPTLAGGLLEFRSKSLELVSLWQNNVSRLEPGAIEGLRADTAVYLNSNKITSLSEGIFRPMLEILTRGDGFLSVKYNPIRCDCELKWLVDRPELLREVRGTCENGTNLRDLRPGSFERCRRCPHECVGARQESLCKPGTVDAGNCHFGKTCCRLENPETATVASTSPSLFHNNTHRDVASAQMNAGNRPCPDGLQCIGKKFQAHCRRGSVKSNSTCPSVNQICCRVAMSQPCPLTHACLHSSARGACEPGTVISAASCRENGICCISTPQNPSRSSPRQHQVAPEDKSGCSKKKIRSRGGIDGLGEETASSNDTVFDPEDIPNCEPCMGRCTVADRIHECRADGQGDFSMFFRCPGELVCCAFRTPIGERRLDVLPADVAHSRNASPDSIVFGDSRCRMVEALCVLTYVVFMGWDL